MLSNKKWLVLLVLLLAGVMVTACATPTAEPVVDVDEQDATEEPTEEATEEPTEEPTEEATEEATEEPTEEATEEPTEEPEDTGGRVGGWLDSVVIVEEPSDQAAFSRLENGDIDMYAYTVANPEVVDQVEQSDAVEGSISYGSYNEMTINPAQCADPATLNPFASREVRYALNYLIDRDYIVNEIYGGLAVPKFVPFGAASLDAAVFAPEIAQIGADLAYDFDRANEDIAAAMEEMGAELVDGVWQYEGAPVEVSVLTRTEDERREIGDYVSNQLEQAGFTVIRDYKTSAEASPLWLQSDPAECTWHVYTAGWGATAIDRNAVDDFQFFTSPNSLYGFSPLWQSYGEAEGWSDDFSQLMDDLANANYATLEERNELGSEALLAANDFAVRVWLIDRISLTPYRTEVEVAADLLAAVGGAAIAPHTLRFEDQIGGEMVVAMPSVLVEPWNPIGGSNWVYDGFVQNFTAEGPFGGFFDPFNGLAYPSTFESAEVLVQEDLPVISTYDWVTLETAPEIEVPDDAWVDWDAEAQQFITAADAPDAERTALAKVTVTYPEGFNGAAWHDGSPVELADFVMGMILTWDQGKEASPYYDESQVGGIESALEAFRGVKIVSEEPLVIETYTNYWETDSEVIAATYTWWPEYTYGQGAWHNMAIGLMTEADNQAAFTADKAEANSIEYLSFIAGPTLDFLSESLQQAIDEGFVPYEATLGQYISDAAARYENLQAFFEERGHYYIGTGPYIIDEVFPVEKTITLVNNEAYPYEVGRFQFLAGQPPTPEVLLDGPSRIASGDEATFDVFVDTPEGEPYPAEDVDNVQYLLFDANGALVSVGPAEEVEAGYYTVTLSGDVTSELEAGANTLTVVVSSSAVALPRSESTQFVTE